MMNNFKQFLFSIFEHITNLLTSFVIMLIVSIVFVSILNVLLFHEPLGMWFVYWILFISIFGAFIMTLQTYVDD